MYDAYIILPLSSHLICILEIYTFLEYIHLLLTFVSFRVTVNRAGISFQRGGGTGRHTVLPVAIVVLLRETFERAFIATVREVKRQGA